MSNEAQRDRRRATRVCNVSEKVDAQVNLSLEGKTAIVTGGGRGIGRGIARALADQGAAVVVNDIFRDDGGALAGETVAEEIRAAGGHALANQSDVSTEAGAEDLIDSAVAAFGGLDILVNCAGNYLRAPIVDLTLEQWDSIINVHLKGHFLACRAAVRQMQKQGRGGRIVTVASRGAFQSRRGAESGNPAPGTYGSVVYSAAKAGIMGFSRTLALQLEGTGITVNCLIPSADTQLFPYKGGSRSIGGTPQPLTLDPEYCAPVVVYLATDAAEYVTGNMVYASGGDICLYGQPLQLHNANALVRKTGKWTVEELDEVLPPLVSRI